MYGAVITGPAYRVNLTNRNGHTCVYAQRPEGHFECHEGFVVLRGDYLDALMAYRTNTQVGEHQ